MIETPRLLLCEIQPSDLDDIARLYSDRDVVRYIGDGEPADRDETEVWLEKALAHWRQYGFGTWCIRLRETGECIGRASLTMQELEHGSELEVGYLLAERHWHQGYATEAAAALIDHAVRDLGFHRLVALIDPDNEASVRVAERLGMVHERQVRFGSRWRKIGRMVDLFVLEIG